MTKFETTDQLFAALRTDLLSVNLVAKNQPKTITIMDRAKIEVWAQKPIYTYAVRGNVVKREIQHESMSAYNALSKKEEDKKSLEAWVAYACACASESIKAMSVYPILDKILDDHESATTKQFLGYKLKENFNGDFERYATAMILVLQNASALLQACTLVKNLSGKQAARNDRVSGIVNNAKNGNMTMHKQIAHDLTYSVKPMISQIGDPIEVNRYGLTFHIESSGIVSLKWQHTTKTNVIIDMAYNGQGFERKAQVVTWIITQLRKSDFVPTVLPSEVTESPTTDQPDVINPELPTTVEAGIADRQQTRKNPANKK